MGLGAGSSVGSGSAVCSGVGSGVSTGAGVCVRSGTATSSSSPCTGLVTAALQPTSVMSIAAASARESRLIYIKSVRLQILSYRPQNGLTRYYTAYKPDLSSILQFVYFDNPFIEWENSSSLVCGRVKPFDMAKSIMLSRLSRG